MNEVQRDVLDALLQMLLGKGLISRTVYDKSQHSRWISKSIVREALE